MLAVLILAIAALLTGLTQTGQASLQSLLVDQRSEQASRDLDLARIALEHHRARIGGYPDTLDAAMDLLQVPQVARPALGYTVSRGLDDGTLLFDRVLVFRPHPTITLAALQADNACGGTAFDEPEAWCLTPAVSGTLLETRDSLATDIAEARTHLLAFLEKLAGYYALNFAFPSLPAAGAPLTAGQTIPLVDFILGSSHGITAANCAGPYIYDSIIVTCRLLFPPPWRTPALYFYQAPDHAGILTTSEQRRSNGQPVLIGHEIRA